MQDCSHPLDPPAQVEDHGSSAVAVLYVLGPGNTEMEFTDLGTSSITVHGPDNIKRLLEYDEKIVECTWNSDRRQWVGDAPCV